MKTFRETRDNDELARSHLRLVWQQSHLFANQVRRGKDAAYSIAEELASVGLVILNKCLRAYRREMGLKFSTLLTIALQREFSRQLQLTRQQRERGQKRLPGALAGLDVDGCQSIDYEGRFDGVPVRQTFATRDDDGREWCPDACERKFRLALRSLPRRDVDMIIDRFIRGRHLHQIGRTYGVSKERVRQLIGRAIREIKNRPELKRRVTDMEDE